MMGGSANHQKCLLSIFSMFLLSYAASMGNLHVLRSFESDYIIGLTKPLLLLGLGQQGLKISVTRLPGSSMESPKFQ
ncbi:hypothetical protein SORBI_3006G068350 [Sorghum bicolor]|jgi:hypothetical protein|uniref:Uncharacterized protein n=1 Tax=Sorghum bicolor TaxID=4558 RepID=A0A1Z5RCP5_SORBI|nr:hypothetical protein SORBI_3006G068350 [Sorghum bicolor]